MHEKCIGIYANSLSVLLYEYEYLIQRIQIDSIMEHIFEKFYVCNLNNTDKILKHNFIEPIFMKLGKLRKFQNKEKLTSCALLLFSRRK